MDSESLVFLLRGGHFSMSERIERGLWPHPPLKYSDIVRQIIEVLDSDRWFPCEWDFNPTGKPIREGGVIEKQSSSCYIYRARRHSPVNPMVVAEETERSFLSAEEAIAYYLEWNLHLPGDLDGWEVIN